MDFARAYTASYEVARVDVGTWSAVERVTDVSSFSITRSCTESVPMLETASMEVGESFEDGWHRLSLVAEQNGKERFNLGVFLFERSGSTYDHGTRTSKAVGYSVLKPSNDILLPSGTYAPMGVNGAEFAASLLRETTPAPVSVYGSFTLSNNVVFDVGMSSLAAAWAVLDAGGFCIQLSGDGTVNIMRMPDDPSIELSRLNSSLLVPGVSDDENLASVPNRYYAVESGEIAVAVNDDPASVVSYPSRGRWVDTVDTSPKRVNGETLTAYARRMLNAASTVTRKVTYSREYDPEVFPFSVVRGSMPDMGLDGDMRVLSQSLDCSHNIIVNETAGQVVRV